MAKSPNDELEVATTAAVVDAVDDTVALDDWCRLKSISLGRRVEALAAFHVRQVHLGTGRATPEWFENAFEAFLAEPA